MPSASAIPDRPNLMRSGLALTGWLAVTFAAAAIGVFFQPSEWYAHLRKPSWNPHNWIFGPVWTTLYAIMSLAAWLVWKTNRLAGAMLLPDLPWVTFAGTLNLAIGRLNPA